MTLERLRESAQQIGKPEWRRMLTYVAELHARSIRPPLPPFPYPWEEIGPGYCYAPAFGHWDIVHQILDVLPDEPEHARLQILNNLANQQQDGLVPGVIWFPDGLGGRPKWGTRWGHPPVWPFAVDDYAALHSPAILGECFDSLVRQIRWFKQNRKAEPHGFYYLDILSRIWESGVDEGIRFLDAQPGPFACVDATAHVYALYDFANRWGERLGRDTSEFRDRASELRTFIQNDLYVPETGFFHDIWGARDPAKRCLAFEGMWPVVVGAATPQQADAALAKLLDPKLFGSAHPIATVALADPRFELRCWRGPAWNSMTCWAARGCVRYGRHAAAAALLGAALDDSARQFERTGTIWEFYHPHGGHPEELQRKPQTPFNRPCRDYLGHNPLLAMTRLYDTAVAHLRHDATYRQGPPGSQC